MSCSLIHDAARVSNSPRPFLCAPLEGCPARDPRTMAWPHEVGEAIDSLIASNLSRCSGRGTRSPGEGG